MENKKIIQFGSLSFILLTVLYLFFLGSIVGRVAQKKELGNILERESQAFYTLEVHAAQKNKSRNLNSFFELGYAESQKFEVIKTVRNVASLRASNY